MSEQFQRQPTLSEMRETEATATRPVRYTPTIGEPFFTGGDLLAFAVILVMVCGPLAMGVIGF